MLRIQTTYSIICFCPFELRFAKLISFFKDNEVLLLAMTEYIQNKPYVCTIMFLNFLIWTCIQTLIIWYTSVVHDTRIENSKNSLLTLLRISWTIHSLPIIVQRYRDHMHESRKSMHLSYSKRPTKDILFGYFGKHTSRYTVYTRLINTRGVSGCAAFNIKPSIQVCCM